MRRAAAKGLLAASRHPHMAVWFMENLPFITDQLHALMALLVG